MHFELLGRSLIVVGWSVGWLAGLSFIVVRPDQWIVAAGIGNSKTQEQRCIHARMHILTHSLVRMCNGLRCCCILQCLYLLSTFVCWLKVSMNVYILSVELIFSYSISHHCVWFYGIRCCCTSVNVDWGIILVGTVYLTTRAAIARKF